VPLAEAVSFAMLASYMWSRTIVPTLAMYLLSSEANIRPKITSGEDGLFRRYQQAFEKGFESFREGYRRALRTALHSPRLFAACFLAFCGFSLLLIGVLGRDFFPKVRCSSDHGYDGSHFWKKIAAKNADKQERKTAKRKKHAAKSLGEWSAVRKALDIPRGNFQNPFQRPADSAGKSPSSPDVISA